MNQIFNRTDFDDLYTLFDPEARYAGYRPSVKERPAGGDFDGVVDTEKRFLHVARKYNPPEWALRLLARAHWAACEIAERIDVPAKYYPKIENGTLRVLEYPIGAGTAEHCDFDLFTVNCYRETPDDLEQFTRGDGWTQGGALFHMGGLGTLVGMGPATPHRVPGRPYDQRSIVYFASPGMKVTLPKPVTFPEQPGFPERTVTTCGDWQLERTARSRVYG